MQQYVTDEQKSKFYSSYTWRKLRQQIKERDNFECQECKRNGLVFIDTFEMNKSGRRKKIKLIVHHKLELQDRPDLALDVDNLETLCVNCHNKLHDRYFKFASWQPKRNRFADDEKW
ncbi:HNH endonuclease signature motif containing protein [Lysinibacillus sp. M3]|uniref:Putative HNH nuclease YajD n=1 Tax=Lysinibacillus zambalensis TaxID=3160866 RepID=A0ABV1MPV4_9BACI